MPTQIPGYHYDSEKGKYFRIQPNHVAPNGSRYSHQAVNAQNVVQQERLNQESSRISAQKTRIERSKVLYHPLLRFDNQLGNRKNPLNEFVSDYFANALTMYKPLSNPKCSRQKSFGHQFDIEQETKDLFIGDASNQSFTASIFRHGNPTIETIYSLSNSKYYPCVGVVLALLAFDPQVFIWATDSPANNLSITRRNPDSSDFHGINQRDLQFETSIAFSMPQTRILDIAKSPDRTHWAVASTDGVHIRDGGNFTFGNTVMNPLKGKEQMVVRFKDRSIFMTGTRSGKIIFGDVRGGKTVRLEHPGAVSGLRVLRNDNHLLVNGLEDMCIYDLRYSKSRSLFAETNDRRNHTTMPALDFHLPPSRTQKRYGLGFDYDQELNIIAAASTDFNLGHYVSLWSATTGKMISCPLSNEVQFLRPVSCIQFADIREGVKSILLTCGSEMHEWLPQGLEKSG